MEESIRERAKPLESAADLDALVARIGDARVVLLGEATHGTREFYVWRAALTERLVEQRGFSLIAVEGDWPDCRAVDRYLAGEGSRAVDALASFRRWPTWMWANREVEDFVEWLRGWNEGHPRRSVRFLGLDVYSLWDSMARVLRFLDARDPEAAKRARASYACFDPHKGDEQAYAAWTRFAPEGCEREVAAVLREVLAKRLAGDDAFDAEQNARVAANAEAYYRAMARNDAESWNLRDEHMMATLARALAHAGPESKAVVWAHNTHVGDARATDMAAQGMTNLGALARERWGPDATFVVGFGTHAGSVIAGRAWDAPMERMRVPPAQEGSWEARMHDALRGEDAWFAFRGRRFPDEWRARRGHRAIGVVYRPDAERGNYVPTDLPARYDAFVFLDRTHALSPLQVRVDDAGEPPETYPFGL